MNVVALVDRGYENPIFDAIVSYAKTRTDIDPVRLLDEIINKKTLYNKMLDVYTDVEDMTGDQKRGLYASKALFTVLDKYFKEKSGFGGSVKRSRKKSNRQKKRQPKRSNK